MPSAPKFRLDRLITLGLMQPLHRLGLHSREYRMPILMYHSISDGPEEKRNPYYWTRTSPKVFAEHMALLHAQGYQAVTLKLGMDRLRSGTAAQTKTVVLTFDDGYRDFLTAAMPIMRRHNFKATMFLPTAYIGETPHTFKNIECLSWSEVRALHQEGIEFGSHTVNHPELVKLDWPTIKSELADSKTEIEQKLGTHVESFAYPYAFPSSRREFVQSFANLLGKLKYSFSVTTQIGLVGDHENPLTLNRLPANSADDISILAAKLRGAYDWLAIAQKTVKYLQIFRKN